MKQPLSICEIAMLLNVPKSTLRYWESVGLIDLNRNKSNHYREYSRNNLSDIFDLVYYRSIHMPLKEMKHLKHATPLELKEILHQLEDDMELKISRLLESKAELRNRINNMECYMELIQNPYQPEEINFNQLYSFDYNSSKAWADCINNQDENLIFYEKDANYPEICMTKAYTKESRILWEAKDNEKGYLVFGLSVAYGDPSASDFTPHLEKLESMGYEVKAIFGRYLFSAFDERRCDFYKGYAQIDSFINNC